MIAIISSTIKPSSDNEKFVSFYSPEERLEQTKYTITRLHESGFDSIFLVDNSPSLDLAQLQKLLQDFPKVKVYHLQQYQFINKGINELLMLLYLIKYLPSDQVIFKISGRYHPSSQFTKPQFVDLAVKSYDFNKKNGTVSTRGYWVKNAETLHRFLLECLTECSAYPERIVGIKSMMRLFLGNKNGINQRLNISIEFAAANILKVGNYQVNLLDRIGIVGYVAGVGQVEEITE